MYVRFVLTAVAGAVLLIAGCVGPIPHPDAERLASSAVNLPAGEAIVFRIDADQIDDPGTVPASLSLAQTVQLGVIRSPELQAVLARVRVAQAEAKQSRLLPNPVLSVALRFPEAGVGKPVIDTGIAADLLAVLRRPGATSAADARLRAASAEAVSTALDVAARAQEHFIAIQSLEASLRVLRERDGLLQHLLELAESRLRIGEGTRLDVVTLQTQRVELEAEIADREIELRDERLALAKLIGQPSSPADWLVADWAPGPDGVPPERELLEAAAELRPEIQQRRWELAALRVERNIATWAMFDSGDVGLAAERDGAWSVGPSASIPIPLFDVGQASRDRTTAAVVEARHELVAVQRQVVEEVRRAYSTLIGTRANLNRVQSQLMPLQETRLRQAEVQFRVGQADITGLLVAEQDVRSTRAQIVELQRRVAIAQVRLERAVGGSPYTAHGPTTATTQPTP